MKGACQQNNGLSVCLDTKPHMSMAIARMTAIHNWMSVELAVQMINSN